MAREPGTRQATLPDSVWARVFPILRDNIGVGRLFQVKQVADHLGIRSPSVSAWINDKGRPTVHNLILVLAFLGHDPKETLPEYFGNEVEPWRAVALSNGHNPDDPEVRDVYTTAFMGAIGAATQFAIAELARREAERKGKAIATGRKVDDGEF